MTLDDLVKETLCEKHMRLRQAKCQHEEIYSSSVSGPAGRFTNAFCLDCGKSLARPASAALLQERQRHE